MFDDGSIEYAVQASDGLTLFIKISTSDPTSDPPPIHLNFSIFTQVCIIRGQSKLASTSRIKDERVSR